MKYKYDFELSLSGYGTVEVYGNSLDECLDNTTVGLESQHGEDRWINLGDLPQKEFNQVVTAIVQKLEQEVQEL